MTQVVQIDTGSAAQQERGTQRLIDIGEEEMWTEFLEKVNTMMLDEKKARQENDTNKGSELCV